MDLSLIVTIVVFFIILAIVKTVGRKGPSQEHAYQLRSSFLSPAERSFYGVLCKAVADNYVVLAKVRVADVITPCKSPDKSRWQSAFNQISSKHFDYILCDPNTLSVEQVVELHDKSHRTTKRAKRDEFLRAACESAGLPLREFSTKARYSIDEVSKRLSDQSEAGRVEPHF